MKFATIKDGSRDGRLAVVSRDMGHAVFADAIAPTLQAALDQWAQTEPQLAALYDRLNAGAADQAFPFDAKQAMAPLPRAWQWLDASAFLSHGELMAKVFRMDNAQGAAPLMYQGLSNRFLSGTEDVRLPCEADGIDFEGEFGIITDDVAMGTTADAAMAHIRLILLINDWSLRALAPGEMKTGFGWVQAKPACSAAPIAVTPDELGGAWRAGRVHLDLNVWWNDEKFGSANGGAMAFGFHELIAHAARTRDLCAGTIIGSGTVSNENYREVGSSCIAERRGIEILDAGAPKTNFMAFGDRVRMTVETETGDLTFGDISQTLIN